MIVGEKEYDVYVLIKHKKFWHWIFWWTKPAFEIITGTSFASAEEAAKSAEIKAKRTGGIPISIAADAIVCCREQHIIHD